MIRIFPFGRFWLVLLLKSAIICAAFYGAFLLRFDFDVPPEYLETFFRLLPWLLVLKLVVFFRMGLFQGWWRYVSLDDVFDILKANVTASLGLVLYVVFFHGIPGVPRSVLVLDGFLCFLLACGVRVTTRAFRENYLPMPRLRKQELSPILIVGAGEAGQTIAREIRKNNLLNKKVVGFIDDDLGKRHSRFQGIPVLGNCEDLADVCRSEAIEEIIIAIPSASGKALRRIVRCCEGVGVKFKTLPSVSDLISETVSVRHIRDVNLDDLLGRAPVRLETLEIHSYIAGKTVLVTGAGGSIGSEICRQVGRFSPFRIILFDNAETPLFYIQNELAEMFPGIPLEARIGDICNKAGVESLFAGFRPQVVFHAAAYKHVPMMELNPAEAVNNNVRGTRIVADMAGQFNAESFVMISTDKAVNPCNIMGASKRAAELYIQGLARRSETRFVTVRFGNVLSSSGSVVPIFQEQIRKGGPVKVTHPEVTRYFMTIPEAVQLVLQAASMGRGGEIFLLEMGEPVKILQLAEELIRLSGLTAYKDVDIVFTGLRPGEKLHEELLLAEEGCQPTAHAKIKIAQAVECDWERLNRLLEDLYQASRGLNQDMVVAKLVEIVKEYRPAVVAGAAAAVSHGQTG